MSEHEELAQWLESEADDYDDFYPPKSSLKLYRAAALLREARPQPVPVPVSERPWKRPGWCDAGGRCWARFAKNGDHNKWAFVYPFFAGDQIMVTHYLECLPHWAIPIPQPPQGGEVEV